MADSQSRPVSQASKNESGICTVCLSQKRLLMRDGTVRTHGPINGRCPGSKILPLRSATSTTNTLSLSTSVDNSPDNLSQNMMSDVDADSQSFTILTYGNTVIPSTNSVQNSLQVTSQLTRIDHPSLPRPTIKHIPRAARHSCAISLAEIFRKIVKEPKNLSAWFDL